MNEEETRALVPIEVRPPQTMLPAQREFMMMLNIASEAVKATGVIPKGIDTAEQAFAVMLAGWELGAPPMTALRHVFVINGKTIPDAQLMMGVVQARDPTTRFTFHELTMKVADVELARASRNPVRIKYTIEDAQRSGQAKKPGPWQEYPDRMLAWNAVRRCCQLGAPDLINAISSINVSEAGAVMEGREEAASRMAKVEMEPEEAAEEYRPEPVPEVPPQPNPDAASAPKKAPARRKPREAPPAAAPSPIRQEAEDSSSPDFNALWGAIYARIGNDRAKIIEWLRERVPHVIIEQDGKPYVNMRHLTPEQYQELVAELSGEPPQEDPGP